MVDHRLVVVDDMLDVAAVGHRLGPGPVAGGDGHHGHVGVTACRGEERLGRDVRRAKRSETEFSHSLLQMGRK